ncbi:hypothetical protein ACSBO6_09210 [Bacillus sp. AL-1R]
MDLSFDKLLEQFDLKKNEHQKNMHKVNKRIDEIESHMEEIKKQLHSFDHQIVNIEKELKTTLSMIKSENETSSLQNKDNGHHHKNENKEHQKQNRHQKQHIGHEHQQDHLNWAENLIHNVEEFSASIFEPNHKGDKEHHTHKEHQHQDEQQEHGHVEEKQHNSRVANRKKFNNQTSDLNQYTASTLDESQSSGIVNELTSMNQKNYSEISSVFSNHKEEQHQNYNHTNVTNEKKTSEQLLETDFSDLSIDDWEDTTTNLSMSEWFEIDPTDKR